MSGSSGGEWPRALHIATERTWRGGEAQAFHLLRAQAEESPGRVGLLAPKGSPLSERAASELGEACALFDLPRRGRASLRNMLALRRAARAFGAELLHCHTAHGHSLAWTAAPWRLPIVSTRRVDFAIPAKGLRGRKYRSPRVWNAAISRAIADILRGAGVREERIALIPSGIDPARFAEVEPPEARAQARREIREELGVGGETVLVGNIAALADHKGQRFLVEAAGLLARDGEERPPLAFVIAGEGEERPALEEAIARNGLARAEGKNVWLELLGQRRDAPRLMAAFDLFAMPSKLEGLGTAALDALWMELPVVASNVGGLPDSVRDGENGLLVPPCDSKALAEALSRLAGSPGERSRLAAAARASVREGPFLAEKMAASYKAFYARALAESRGGRLPA